MTNVLHTSSRQSERGSLLLEAIIAAAIIAIASLVIVQLIMDTRRMNQAIQEQDTVQSALERELKLVQVTPFDDIGVQHDGRAFDILWRGGKRLQASGDDLDGSVGLVRASSPGPPHDPSQVIDVLVEVRWRGISGDRELTRRIRLSRVGAPQPAAASEEASP